MIHRAEVRWISKGILDVHSEAQVIGSVALTAGMCGGMSSRGALLQKMGREKECQGADGSSQRSL